MMDRILVGLTVLLILTPSFSYSGELTIGATRIIRTGDQAPGTNGTFQSFGVGDRPVSPPVVDDGDVVFWGETSDLGNNNQRVHGLFRYSSGDGIERLVDSTMLMPGKSDPFEDITEFSANQGNVAFLGARYTEGFEGTYSLKNGNLELVADSTTLLPGISGASSRFYHPLIEGDRIAFVTEAGIFQSQQSLIEPLVLAGELIPGRADTFQGFGNISFDNEVLSFWGLGPSLGTGLYDKYEGIFTDSSTGQNVEVDVSAVIPNGTGSFLSFRAFFSCGGTTFGYSLCSSGPVLQNGQVVFGGWDSTFQNHGLYTSLAGTVTTVADHLSVLPGDTASGAFFDQPTLDQGAVAFSAYNPFTSRQGVYLWDGQEIHKIFDSTDGAINGLRVGPQGLHRNQLVFSVESGDGSEAIHIVELIRSTTIQADKDSLLYSKKKNKNEGSNPTLVIGQDQGTLRSVVSFNLRGISPASVNQATLMVNLQEPVTGLGSGGQLIQVRQLLENFDEGNGKRYGVPKSERLAGDGRGVTWNCSSDTNIANRRRNCDVPWLGGNLVAGPVTAEVMHLDGQTGQVTWDVTLDVLQALANEETEVNWLVRFANESANGIVEYFSKEGAVEQNDNSLAPSLVIEP